MGPIPHKKNELNSFALLVLLVITVSYCWIKWYIASEYSPSLSLNYVISFDIAFIL